MLLLSDFFLIIVGVSAESSNTICSIHLFTQNFTGGVGEKKKSMDSKRPMYSRGGWDDYVYNPHYVNPC